MCSCQIQSKSNLRRNKQSKTCAQKKCIPTSQYHVVSACTDLSTESTNETIFHYSVLCSQTLNKLIILKYLIHKGINERVKIYSFMTNYKRHLTAYNIHFYNQDNQTRQKLTLKVEITQYLLNFTVNK